MDFLATLYMLAFAACGILISRFVFRKDDPLRRVFFGLVFGLVMLIWLPTLLAFLMGFTLTVQFIALGIAVLLACIATVLSVRAAKKGDRPMKFEKGRLASELVPLLVAAVPLVFIGFVLHLNHTIVPASNGSLHVGQCTYGDLCMHLGFISSISVQQTFPPDYSILPGTPLGYPFLCDSVSSTFYTLGASLRTATLLPALYAYFVAVVGIYFFFDTWFKNKKTSVLATYFFLIGGGIGFYYIFNNKQLLAEQGIDRIKEMLGGFYKTPTNLPAEGLRWVNAIADMLLPQRATLFGWALLFPGLQLLYRGAIGRENRVFIPLGVIAGAMPLVHTHSFLALGLISLLLFVAACLRLLTDRRPCANSRLAVRLIACFIVMLAFAILKKLPIRVVQPEKHLDRIACTVGTVAAGAAALIFALTAAIRRLSSGDTAEAGQEEPTVVISLFSGLAAAALCALTVMGIRKDSIIALAAPLAGIALFTVFALLQKRPKDIEGRFENDPASADGKLTEDKLNLLFFALFGFIAVALAAPQLFGFTLKQSGNSESFLRWSFNWDNESDSWLWFYIKNLGLLFILMPVAFITAKKEHRLFYAGGLLIWVICEILLFQPNPYDNNKLLFVWFALTCGIVADLLIRTLASPARKTVDGKSVIDGAATAGRYLLLVIAIVTIMLSGVMTLQREYVSADHYDVIKDEEGKSHFGYKESGYEVTPSYMVEATDWIKANTPADSTFLTHNNHNNAVAMLTGRNIFCGAGTFLYFHGVDYRPREVLIRGMYEDPGENLIENAKQYSIDYVVVSPYETGNYSVYTGWFEKNLECVYSNEQVRIYRIAG